MSVEKEALEMIKAVYDDGIAEINSREYQFTKMRHNKRRSVFAFYTSIANQLQTGSFSFLDTSAFNQVEKIINDSVLYNGSALSRLPEHWDEFPEDYITFISTALGVISYPFLRGSSTGSQSQDGANTSQKSLKPM